MHKRILSAAGPAGAAAGTIVGSHIAGSDGTPLFYRDWGSGRPMLFLAPWGMPSDMWQYQMVPLSEQGLRCVAYDRRGHGRSGDSGRGYDFDTLADDLAAVIEALDLHDITLVGLSFAAGEMVRYVTRHGPARLAGLVFLAPACTPFVMKTADNPEGIDPAMFEAFRRQILMGDYPKWLEDNGDAFVVPETSQAMRNWLKGLMLGNSMKALVEFNRAATATDFRSELLKITIPTLVIHGDKDASGAARTHRPAHRRDDPWRRVPCLRRRAAWPIHHPQGAAERGSARLRAALISAAGGGRVVRSLPAGRDSPPLVLAQKHPK